MRMIKIETEIEIGRETTGKRMINNEEMREITRIIIRNGKREDMKKINGERNINVGVKLLPVYF